MSESPTPQPPPLRASLPRRHEIDALRSIALLLLIAYHVFAAFQPFGPLIQFITYEDTLEEAWFLGELVNPWRIPVLFLIAGITAGYLLQTRPAGRLISSRLMRLVPPLLFAAFFVAPLNPALFQLYQGAEPTYAPNPGHLWFVWNLVAYFVFGFPFFLFLKRRPDNLLLRFLKRLTPWGWILVLPLVLTAVTRILEPHITTDAFATHFQRFWYGFACFLSGAFLVSLGDVFWQGLRKVGHVALPVALGIYLARMLEVDFGGTLLELTARTVESVCGMLAFLGYGSLLLSRPARIFSVLNRSVFAVYIVHLPVQQAVAFYLFRVDLDGWIVFALHTSGTLAFSFLIYAVVLRPIRWLHPFFGIAPLQSRKAPSSAPEEAAPARPSWPARAARVATLYVATPILVLTTAGFLIATAFGQISDSEFSPLRAAIFEENLEGVRRALAQEADVNGRDGEGWTDFSMAIFARSPEALEIMLDHDPDLSMRSNDGQTLLWAACWISDSECMRILLENGADESLSEEEVADLDEILNRSYESVASEIRLFMEPPPEEDYLENRQRIRELLEEAGVVSAGGST